MNSRMVALMALAQEQGIKIVHVGTDAGREIVGRGPSMMILDDDWAEFANSDDNEPYKITSHKTKIKVRNPEKSQNNDWRKVKKGKGFSGYHREF